jgi:hypothetical protein
MTVDLIRIDHSSSPIYVVLTTSKYYSSEIISSEFISGGECLGPNWPDIF